MFSVTLFFVLVVVPCDGAAAIVGMEFFGLLRLVVPFRWWWWCVFFHEHRVRQVREKVDDCCVGLLV